MTKQVSREDAQEAVDAVDRFGSILAAARALRMTRGKLECRLRAADLQGIARKKPDESPTNIDDFAEIEKLEEIRKRYSAPAPHFEDNNLEPVWPARSRDGSHIGRRHIVIPDVQTKDGVPQEHLSWIGNYLAEKRPDVIVCIGDFADLPSLSIYDKGKLPFEGRRYVNDIEAARRGMSLLLKPIDDYNRTAHVKYNPRKVLTMGNHEHRIIRTVDNNPEFVGKFQLSDLGYEDFGWEVVPFLVPIVIDGIEYCHYFTSGVMGRPVSSAAALLRARQRSATMGHVQSTDMAMHQKTQQTAMFCGTCYLHDEPYLGPQGNVTRRQIVVKNEVENGVYDPMLVSLNYLRKKYAG